jgi:hypothetical protein
LPGYLWALPHTLVGLLLWPAYGGRARWRDGCVEIVATRAIWGRPDAQTHGWIIFLQTEADTRDVGLAVHERTHVLQGFFGGPLYVVAYVLCFLALWAWQRRSWRDAYAANPFEKQAYRRQAEYYRGRRDLWGV